MSEPCNDCPERGKSEPVIPEIVAPKQKPQLGLVIYTGGPAERHLSMMQHTLPADYTKGEFLPDGSIQYEKGDDWEPPSPVEGYERDAEDQWLFRPLWKSCQFRVFGTEIKETCECIQVLAACSHPETDLGTHGEVTFNTCEECPHRVPIPESIVPRRTPAGPYP